MISVENNDSIHEIKKSKSSGFNLVKLVEAEKILALEVDGKLKDLSFEVLDGSKVKLISSNSKVGLSILRHSAAHLLGAAVQELYPDAKLAIGPSIENGFYYDFDREKPFSENELVDIEKRMKEIVKRDDKFLMKVWTREEAIKFYKERGENYKVELIETVPESEEIKIYEIASFIDPCRGPHVISTRYLKHFKLTKVSGAYWRGDSKNKMLQRIYGTAWDTKEALENYLNMLKEAEKRDHRKLGKEMDLYHFEPEYAPGCVFLHHKGLIVHRLLIEHMREKQDKAGYTEISTPAVMDRCLWETSGHWEKYGEHNYSGQTEDGKVYCIKPMNCPGGILVYKQGIKSYKDLPMKVAEFGRVNRYEASGALQGLLRVREFIMDDAHIYCTPEQMEDECIKTTKFILQIYKDFGFDDVEIRLATRPENRIGSDEVWDLSEKALKDALEKYGFKYTFAPGEGAFYGPKLEFHLRDSIGRQWQCGTVQVDMNLPERFDMTYIGEDGQKHRPVMIHRALLGSIERFLGVFIEHHAGKLPLWLAPVQAVVTGLTNDFDDYAEEIYEKLKSEGVRVEIDKANEKVGYKIRQHSLQKIPYILVVGQKEKDSDSVSVRMLDNEKQEVRKVNEFVKELKEKIEKKS